MTPKELATKIIAGIISSPDVSYGTLEAHAATLGISSGIFENAMVQVHKNKTVYGRMKRGEIIYAPKIKVVKTPGTHLKWVRDNYPEMNSSNDGSGIEADYSYMFLTPEEFDKYKAELQGRTFIPKKRYRKKV